MATNYHCDETGPVLNYDVISEVITGVRMCGAPIRAEWKMKIDADCRRRKVADNGGQL